MPLKRVFKSALAIYAVTILLACNARENQNDSGEYVIDPEEQWSVRLSDSFIFTHPGATTYDERLPKDKWTYEQGVMLEAMRQMWIKSGDQKYFNFIKDNIDQYVQDNGKIRTYKYTDFNLDKINTGRQLLFLYEETGLEKYKIAADTLRKQIENQPRTKIGGFWHKKIYPYQMWLDGLYMAEPFYARYINMFEEPKNYDDVTHQITTVYEKTLDKGTGLLYHAWNENREQEWADKMTGHSPHFWGRAIGWYMMSIVDVLDILPEDNPDRGYIIEILQNVSGTLVNYKDSSTGLWYQIIDLGERDGNYLESSCAAMFTYAFAKGANKGYLDKKYLEIAEDTFKSIVKQHVTIDDKGLVSLHNTCSGAGLGGNPYRDGSFEYYMSVPQSDNDFKGYGPLIFAAVELEKAGMQ